MQKNTSERKYRVCVFASSSDEVNPKLLSLAERLGTQLVKHGYAVVYGGTTQGCMGRLAAGVTNEGGKLLGIVPRALHHLTFSPLSEYEITEDVYSRQRAFELVSDAFIALPGGVGTVAELFSLINTRLLGAHAKPIVLLNAYGSFEPVIELLRSLVEEKFASDSLANAYSVAPNVSSALRLIENHAKTLHKKPIEVEPQSLDCSVAIKSVL